MRREESMDSIKIKDLEVYGNHGVFKEENILGQKFLISATLYTDIRAAGLTDDLTKSIHYGETCQMITAYVKGNTFKLIEAVAEGLAEHLLLQIENLKQVKIEVKKPWAPIGLPLDMVSVEIERSWHEAYIGIGSNMGDKEGYLKQAILFLGEFPTIKVIKSADFIVTKPVGYLDQDDFLNGCLEVQTTLTPLELLGVLQEAEKKADRERSIHWGPRTLDMDLLLYDDQVLDSERLLVPHSEMHKRRFVLEPLAKLAPNKRHPLLNKRISELLEELED